MNNKLEIFKNEEFGEVKVLELNGEPWFVGNEITKILGYKNGSRDINRHVDQEDRQNYQNGTSEINNRGITIINESGLYSLILSSKLKSAKKFKRWVTSEVLPAIRKQGTYQMPKTPMETLSLMFEVSKDHEERLLKIDEKVTDFDERITSVEENAPLSPGEYAYLGTKVHERIRIVKSDYALINATRKQVSALYRAINHDINEVAGVNTRTQIRKKDFDRVLELIRDWTPSKALMMNIDQVSFEI